MLKQHTKCGKLTQIRKDVIQMLDEDYNEYIRVDSARQSLVAIKRVIRMNTLENALKVLEASYNHHDVDLFYKVFVEKYMKVLRYELYRKGLG